MAPGGRAQLLVAVLSGVVIAFLLLALTGHLDLGLNEDSERGPRLYEPLSLSGTRQSQSGSACAPPRHFNSSKVAILVETRMHPRLLPVLANFLAVLGADWRFQLFLSPANAPYVASAHGLRHWIANGKIKIEMLHQGFTEPSYRGSYNQIMKNASFWERVDGEHVLVFQTDTALCRRSNNSIDDFLDWDFVGAPWDTNSKCGNGGLSLRKKSSTLDVIRRDNGSSAYNEDQFFCERLAKYGYKVAPYITSRRFSIEMAYFDLPAGVHQVFYHHRIGTDWLYKIHETCPEARVISPPQCRLTSCAADPKVRAMFNKTLVCSQEWRDKVSNRTKLKPPIQCDITAGWVPKEST